MRDEDPFLACPICFKYGAHKCVPLTGMFPAERNDPFLAFGREIAKEWRHRLRIAESRQGIPAKPPKQPQFPESLAAFIAMRLRDEGWRPRREQKYDYEHRNSSAQEFADRFAAEWYDGKRDGADDFRWELSHSLVSELRAGGWVKVSRPTIDQFGSWGKHFPLPKVDIGFISNT